MLLTESNSTLTMIILAFAVMGLPQCGLLAINYLYQKNQQALTFPEKLGKKTPARDMMYLVFGCFTYLGMLFILPASTMSILLLQILFVTLSLMVICTDLDQQVILDAVNLVLAIGGILFIFATDLPFMEHILTGLGSGLAFLLLAIVTRGGIGGGDIKFMAALGLWLGYSGIINAFMIGAVLGGIVALMLMITKRLKRGDLFAYGAYYAIGGMIAFVIKFSPVFAQ